MSGMDERAAMYMSGPPDAVLHDAYSDGPTPYSLDLVRHMPEGHVLVGKSRNGSVVFREQMQAGKLVPWTPPGFG